MLLNQSCHGSLTTPIECLNFNLLPKNLADFEDLYKKAEGFDSSFSSPRLQSLCRPAPFLPLSLENKTLSLPFEMGLGTKDRAWFKVLEYWREIEELGLLLRMHQLSERGE